MALYGWRTTGDAPASQTREEVLASVYPALAALRVLCGCVSDQKAREKLAKAFRQRTGPLLDKCLRFRKMTGEGVAPTDIQPYAVATGDERDPRSVDLEYEGEKDEAAKEKQGAGRASARCGVILCIMYGTLPLLSKK